jgi:hypothetical protein
MWGRDRSRLQAEEGKEEGRSAEELSSVDLARM